MNAEQLKALREKLELTQEEMAQTLGIATRTYIYIEKGERKPNKTVDKLAEVIRGY